MLEKHDVKRSRTARQAGGASRRPISAKPAPTTSSGKAAAEPKRPPSLPTVSSCSATSRARRRRLRERRVGAAHRGHHRRERQGRLRAEGRRGPQELDPDRDQRRRPEVLPRHRRHAGARALGAPADLAASPTPSPAGARKDGYFADDERRRGVQRRAQAPARPAEDVVQLAGLVQRRRRGGPAVLGLLHQQRRRHDGVDPRAGQDRGHAVQVRLGHRHQPVADPLVEGAPQRRRHGLGPGHLHARLRRVRRRHQVGRQDPPRGQDGHPQRRPPRRRRVHRLQGRRKRRRRGR